ncbi:M16 family metallopeptidase [Thauera linaloolentis]|uniref:Peptidase M16 domain-containing protein n=1 Tax=Thauera linaloolentis (strain DSM 12138 / JCM 21573 / CCUG 41526 / CIP 105981 / IAM 15112 / NBRC 102519 / 47Lol) TaxID=1123367 RepID=N6Z3E5_THAL4|nr:pitrilysin family protein [Thauera linaloolentis]ENO89137.1 peptidase M16 domain-containing protein [Thauera linaloolentis 47Lol = DSM 12138]MCM8565716.1 insulinase family protein [Thauera linaloolentis]
MTTTSRLLTPVVAGLALLAQFAAGPALAGPKIEQWTAPTGARVLYVESRALPLVDIQIDFAAGSAYEPAGKTGLASLTRSLLDAGTTELDEQQIAERIADIGAQIGGGTDSDRASLSIRSLSSAPERDAAVELGAGLLAQPGFPADILERERRRAIAGLREALTKPATLAARRFNEALYAGHPYGGSVTPESLESITRDDLVDFHRTHFGAQRASVAIVGDVDRATAERIAIRLTEHLPPAEAPAALPSPAMTQAAVLRIANPSAQAHILVGQPGMAREDADYFPLLVGNYVLGGGGFVSRLTKEVREKRGFAYSVYSYFSPQQVAGPFQIGLQTRGNQADEALGVVRDTLDGFIAEGPSAEELQAAKDNLINGFGLRLDSNAKILGYVSMIGFYRLPLDWLDSYPQHVAAVDAGQVRDAFARRVRSDQLITVIAGGDGDTAETAPSPAPAEAAR